MSSLLTPLRQSMGWECLLDVKTFLKYSLEEDKTTLCADICCWSSLTSVTSLKLSDVLSFLKVFDTFVWKSFHFKQNFSVILKLKGKVKDEHEVHEQ